MMLMASSSSIVPQVKHDVFLNFRGEDTRGNFTSHLHTALCDKKIDTFIDDQLIRGDQISPALLNAIEESQISVVIFSEGYASSRWCLEELEKILECRRSYGRVVIPVFYRVDPSDVRNQRGAFGNGFAKVEERFNDEPGKLQKWKNALREAADLSGFDSNVFRSEPILIDNIVKDVLKKLNDESMLIDNKNLVGINSRIEQIESLLCNNRKIGIWGIGGIGKTTLARVVFYKLSRHFEGFCFIQNIREESKQSKGLTGLRQKLFSKILHEKDVDPECTFTRRRLGRTKVLIVFDDVTHLEQIESLIGDLDYLSSESRIIITTRDKHVLENCEVDNIYKTEVLSDDIALKLFSQCAFSQDCPGEDFIQLSTKVLIYAKGVPLALKVLGSHLFKRTKQQWKSAINRLTRIPHVDIQDVLKVSYDGLNDEEKNIFLDITCFFKGWNRYLIEEILDACGFDTHIGITVLIERSLITESFNTITMHDLLQEMGRDIIRQESPNDPGKRSRLWHHEDIYSVLTKNTGTRKILGMCLDLSQVEEIHLNPKAFSEMHNLRFLRVYSSSSEDNNKVHGMHNLRFLKVYNSSFEDNNKVHGFEFIESDFSELRYLFWFGYSTKSLPPNFHPKKLVALDMQFSNIEQLLLGGQDLVNLKYINLSNSHNLLRILDLSQTPNLESLILEGCTSLNKIFSSIHNLNRLVTLNLQGCVSFNTLPSGIHWKFLRELNMSYCSNLKKVPFIPRSVEELYLDNTTIEELSSIEDSSRLERLILHNCPRLRRLSNDISKLRSLTFLDLYGCSKLKMIPKISSKMIGLLYLQGTAIKELPSLKYPFRLHGLYLDNCSRLESLPKDIYRLEHLSSLSLRGCSKLDRLPDSLGDLKALELLYANEIAIREVPSSIVCLKILTSLHLGGNNFESLPTMKDLSNLYRLLLINCKRLQSLPELPHKLGHLIADGCSSLKALSGLPNLCLSMRNDVSEMFSFMNCFKLNFNALPEMREVLQRIQQNADVWFWSKDQVYRCTSPRAFINFPGSEVPGWFNCKSTGSFIELPTGWLKDNLVGIALCVVLSPPNNHKNKLDKVWGPSLLFHLSINDVKLFSSYYWDGWTFNDISESDHVFLGYDYHIMQTDELHTFSSDSKGSIQFYVNDEERVKNCGVRLLYTGRDGEAEERMKRGKRKRRKTINGGYEESCGGCCGTDEKNKQ